MVPECPHQSLELLDITIIIYYKNLIRIVPSIQFYHAANVAIMVHIRIFNGLACARSVTLWDQSRPRSWWDPWSFCWSSARQSCWWVLWQPHWHQNLWPQPRRGSASRSFGGRNQAAWILLARRSCWPSPGWSSRCWRGLKGLLRNLKWLKTNAKNIPATKWYLFCNVIIISSVPSLLFIWKTFIHLW